MAGGDDQIDEDRRRYFRDIGLASAQRRMRMLDRRSHSLRTRGGVRTADGSDHKRGSLCAGGVDMSPRLSIDATGMAGTGLDDNAKSTADHSSPMRTRAGEMTSPRTPRTPRTPLSARSARQRAPLQKELEEARRELQSRVQKFREELVEDMRAHEVSLLTRPTSAEMEDPKMKSFKHLRRPHHRVVVGRDEKEIKWMPNHKLCINEDLKKSLKKMRENLFQRRLNLAIYEKTVGDWSLPQLRHEVRRQRAPAANALAGYATHPGLTATMGATTGGEKLVLPASTTQAGPQTGSHGEQSADLPAVGSAAATAAGAGSTGAAAATSQNAEESFSP
mmetsp:Transcript_119401/g.207297  ORF Transcript_119401/g.207297 Transcript_119401/m.207297 type:complete len:334 (-) Transcript_119401:66-1067(-)